MTEKRMERKQETKSWAGQGASVMSPAHQAAFDGNWEALEKLRTQGVDLHAPDTMGRPPVYWAVFNGHMDLLRKLLGKSKESKEEKGAETRKIDLNAQYQDGQTLMHLAITSHRYQEGTVVGILECLKEHGADLNAPSSEQTPAHLAAQYGQVKVLEFLKNNGVNVKDRFFAEVAARYGQVEVLKFLQDNGVNSKDDFLAVAVEATKLGQINVLEFLQAQTPLREIDVPDPWEYRLVHMAALYGQVNVLEFLHRQGFNLNQKVSGRQGLAHIAAYGGWVEVLKFLKTQGVDLNAPDKAGRTPADMAVLQDHLGCTSRDTQLRQRRAQVLIFLEGQSFLNNPYSSLIIVSCVLLLASEATFLGLKFSKPQLMTQAGGDATLIVNSALLMIVAALLCNAIRAHYKKQMTHEDLDEIKHQPTHRAAIG